MKDFMYFLFVVIFVVEWGYWGYSCVKKIPLKEGCELACQKYGYNAYTEVKSSTCICSLEKGKILKLDLSKMWQEFDKQ